MVSQAQCAEKFWAIAHMANNDNVIGWSLAAGANALEIDVTFNSAGNPTETYHGTPCDCSCLITTGVCQFPISQICTARHPIGKVLQYFMSHEYKDQVALIYFDSKMGAVPEKFAGSAGTNMVKMLEQELFDRGYEGNVLIGGGKEEYLRSLTEQSMLSKYQRQIFVTYDMYSRSSEALKYMAQMQYTNKIFSAGISMCAQPFYNFESEAVLGRINKAKGVITDTIIWTLDREDQFDKYYNYGARGIISNNIAGLVQWAKRRGYNLYTKNDTLKGTTAGTESLVLSRGTCYCKRNGTGCVITTPAPQHSACKCTENTEGVCVGKVVGCKDLSDPYCLTPDISLKSCYQSQGDCKGYSENLNTCDCTYESDGCKISKAAIEGKACRCTLVRKGETRSCQSEVVDCQQQDSPYCTNSTSIQSCIQGGGNCDGYSSEKCNCKKNKNGCIISSPAPKDTACQCNKVGGDCSGSSTVCHDESLATCKNPDSSLSSCAQGNGNCNGYPGGCECYYVNAGCRISKAAPPGSACRCTSYWLFGNSCYGEVVGCGNLKSDECKNPDVTIKSCHQGLGNCAGY